MGEGRFLWQGARNFVELTPESLPAHILRVRKRVRTERDFDYYSLTIPRLEAQQSKEEKVNTQLLSNFDLHLLMEGTHYRTYEKLGAHIVNEDGVRGVHFGGLGAQRVERFHHGRVQRLESRPPSDGDSRRFRDVGAVHRGPGQRCAV